MIASLLTEWKASGKDSNQIAVKSALISIVKCEWKSDFTVTSLFGRLDDIQKGTHLLIKGLQSGQPFVSLIVGRYLEVRENLVMYNCSIEDHHRSCLTCTPRCAFRLRACRWSRNSSGLSIGCFC